MRNSTLIVIFAGKLIIKINMIRKVTKMIAMLLLLKGMQA